MFKQLFSLLALTIMVISCSAQKLDDTFLKYIEKNKDFALREMERAGIPASIKLAQGLLESNAGRSYLAKKGNNHFGIKCGSNWKGKKVYRKDDEYNSKGKLIESCFRSFRSTEACYIAHSEFLRNPNKQSRYGFLFRLDPRDYKRWAKGLKKAGYATSATYAEKLISIIERYNLNKYDQMLQSDLDQPVADVLEAGIFVNNDVKYATAAANETVADIAKRTDTSLRSLLKYNEKISDGNQQLKEGQRIYIQPKRSGYRAKRLKWHVMKEGEDMFDVSQNYGVKLKKILRRNRLEENMLPAVGEQIKLRGWKVKERPKLATEAKAEDPEKEELEMEEAEEEITQPDEDPAGNNIDEIPVIQPPKTDSTSVVPTAPKEEDPPAPTTPEEPKATEEPTSVPDFTEEPVKEEAEVVLPAPPATAAVYHTVSQGDTLWNISQRYNTKVDAIKKLNKLTSNSIRLGMKLRVK
jgi:LysM repeat protein